MRTKLLIISTVLSISLSACGGGGGGGSSNQAPVATTTTQPQQNGPSQSPSQDPEPEAGPPSPVIVNVLALITPGVEAQFVDPDLRIQHLFNTTNDVLLQSEASAQFRVNHLEVVTYPDSLPISQALDDLTAGSHIALNQVHSLRDSTNSDLVVLFRPYANDGHCGYAWVGGYQRAGDFSHPDEPNYGFAVVAANCTDYTLAHELGHNMGLAHSRREDPEGGTFVYATGYGEDGDFVTIMASPTEFSATQLPLWSSPDLTCNSSPCGIVHTEQDGANAVRAINITAPQVAEFR